MRLTEWVFFHRTSPLSGNALWLYNTDRIGGMLLFGGAQKVTKKAPAQTPRGLGLRHWFGLCMPAADGHRARPRVHPTRSASCLAQLVDISPSSSSSFPSPRPPCFRVRQCLCNLSYPCMLRQTQHRRGNPCATPRSPKYRLTPSLLPSFLKKYTSSIRE